MYRNFSLKSVISVFVALVMIIGMLPVIPGGAAQKTDYVDPADTWITSNNRTNELDVNATVTNETQLCCVCNKETGVITYRVPEYTKTGETALNRDVRYSDGTKIDGINKGNLDSGTPGVDAYYTGMHWTKSVCQTCGTINTGSDQYVYSYNKNIYMLNSCDQAFYLDFDNTAYEEYDEQQHKAVIKKGTYCQFCKGTYARASERKEAHRLESRIDGQLGNNRFYLEEHCEDCGYETQEFVSAKSVVSSYYGTADGMAHTISVADLSDRDVHTRIRYGDSAESCSLTSAPNYTEAGYYPVYYEIDYKLEDETMTENGVSYVWLLDNSTRSNDTGHTHDYRYLETVKPTCGELGYERWQCVMCGGLVKQNYTKALEHNYRTSIISEATCTQNGRLIEVCNNCGEFTEYIIPATEHSYEEEIIAPTCKSSGYTKYTCRNCDKTYMTDVKDVSAHKFNKIVKNPTCTDEGYTTNICLVCHISYVDSYVDAIGHNWDEGRNVTLSTCESEGVIEHKCLNCNEKMIISENAKGHTAGSDATCTEPQKCIVCDTILELAKGHEYSTEVTNPTCTAMGYTTYTCDCGDTYTADYTDMAKHEYAPAITNPTCTEYGFTTYLCKNCDAEYVSDYTDKSEHNYSSKVTEPTCTKMGFTEYTCEDCGDNFKSDYTDRLDHTPSDWIIDVPNTIENPGSKHIECVTCKEVLYTVALLQLVDRDFSDEDGNVVIGKYSIRLSDKDNMPVFNSEVTIDVRDNVNIKLPDGRLLDFADQTDIKATLTETGEAAENLAIFAADKNSNRATGRTDANGSLKVPNDKSSTGDDNGTIGNADSDKKNTYVVKVTDKANVIIPDCDIRIGESNNIVVDLPSGIKPSKENPVIVTITDQTEKAIQGVSVIAMGDADFVEKGITDIYGKITLPTTSEGYTDEAGKVNVDNINVIVNDETKVIPDAYVKHNEDGSIDVTLPKDKYICYANRITVTVLNHLGEPMADITVSVTDEDTKSCTDITNKDGVIVVPNLDADMTDAAGTAKVNEYNVILADETKPIENAFIEYIEDVINIVLPEGITFDYNNRITATVSDKDNKPVKDMTVVFTDTNEKSETNLTDENGRASVPPINIDYTDINGYSEVDGYIVTVVNETGSIEKAKVVHNKEIKNEDEIIKTPENISIELPDGVKFAYDNRITVSVINKAENTPVKDMEVIISEIPSADAEPEELKGKTNDKGKAVFPPINEDITDDKGDSGVTEEKPGKGEDTDGDGKEDKPGEAVSTTYVIKVNDTKGIVNGAFIEIKDGKVYVALPEEKTLTTANQTTVTVLGKDNKPVQNISVTVKDKTTEKTANTNSNGQITVPVKTSGQGGSSGGSSSGSSSGGGGGGSYSTSTVNVKVTDKDGKNVSVSKQTAADKVTLTLPTGKNLSKYDNYYTITVTDRNGKAKADFTVVLKDSNKNELTAKTNKEGVVTLPAKEHKAYIVGYDDGTFRPDSDMTRAEAAAIFARLIAEEKGEAVKGSKTFNDIEKGNWCYEYIGYLAKYDIIKGYTDGSFKPENKVTRAEFVTMAVRYHKLFNDVKSANYTVKYTDLNKDYWAYNDIALAKNIGWLNGYADGSFRGDNNITRAEVVTVVNRATGRSADKEYINENLTKLNRFTDLKNNEHWAFYDIIECSNDHMAVTDDKAEIWVK